MQLEAPAALPEPDTNSAVHSQRCADYIRSRIEDAGGSISFAEYMHHALYAPGFGYYAAGAHKFGAGGDFVTAPEVSPLFGYLVARQCAEIFEQIDSASIIEFGAGSGRLAADVIAKLGELGSLPERYQILEVSADLRERQESLLREEAAGYFDRIDWITAIPKHHAGVIIANEVLDALPVERFTRRNTVCQHRVQAIDNGFKVVAAEAPENLRDAVMAIEAELGGRLPDGYTSEVSLGASGLISELVEAMQHGVALLFDYGLSRREYYAADRSDGWLRCHFRHHAHNDALLLPGVQDITAWVDFTAIASAAADAGADIAGYSSQAQFLIGAGLDAELQNMMRSSPERQVELSGQAKLLTLPAEMGENFKCLGVSRGTITQPTAFAVADRTHTL